MAELSIEKGIRDHNYWEGFQKGKGLCQKPERFLFFFFLFVVVVVVVLLFVCLFVSIELSSQALAS